MPRHTRSAATHASRPATNDGDKHAADPSAPCGSGLWSLAVDHKRPPSHARLISTDPRSTPTRTEAFTPGLDPTRPACGLKLPQQSSPDASGCLALKLANLVPYPSSPYRCSLSAIPGRPVRVLHIAQRQRARVPSCEGVFVTPVHLAAPVKGSTPAACRAMSSRMRLQATRSSAPAIMPGRSQRSPAILREAQVGLDPSCRLIVSRGFVTGTRRINMIAEVTCKLNTNRTQRVGPPPLPPGPSAHPI